MNEAYSTTVSLDNLLEAVSRCFTPETARALVALRPLESVQLRMEELGAKAGEGQLTVAEAREYETLIETGDLIATLQLKARRLLPAAESR
jgi:hypothetical protein